MVKNTSGGCKGKKVARKNMSYGTHDVRKSTDDNEMYAVVTKIYSSQRCSVFGSDGKTYNCNVRGKFLKNKRGCGELCNGVWILIGFYDWEVRSDGSKNCDLLEIYSSIEKDKLKQFESSQKLSHLLKIEGIDTNEMTFSNFNINDPGADTNANDDSNKDEEIIDMDNNEKSNLSMHDIYNSPQSKENLKEQTDWLSIDVDEI